MKNRIIPSIIISFACTLVVIFGIKCYNIYNIDKIVNQEVVENKDLYEVNYCNCLFITRTKHEADSLYKAKCKEVNLELNKPYKMITSFRDTSMVDYGTFRELDSVKCIRKAQMERVKQRRIIQEGNKEKELKLLNSPCGK